MPSKRNAPRVAEAPSFSGRTAVLALRRADPRMGLLIDRVGPFKLELGALHSPFDALAQAITYQQLNGKAASTILGRVRALFPNPKRLDPAVLLKLPEPSLRGAGLSRNKLAAIRDLAVKTLDGTVPGFRVLQRLSDDEVIERLTQVRGIGRWTVEMLLMFRLGRPDVLPADDFGVRKGFARVYRKRKMPTPKQLLAYGERWRPYRTAASWYLWRALELSEEAWAA